MKRSSVIALMVIFTLIALTFGGLAAWKYRSAKAQANKPQEGPPPESVQVVEARTISWGPTSELVGTVVATQTVMIASELAGTIAEVNFQSGSLVKKGDVLVQLEDSTERSDLAAAEAALRVAEAAKTVGDARLNLARSELNRVAEAVKVNATAAANLDRAKAEEDQAKADVERLSAEIDQSKARIGQVAANRAKKTIRAPFSGRVGLRNVHPGTYLAEGGQIVMLQEVGDEIFLDFAIPQEHIGRAKPGMTVMATSKVLGDEPVQIKVTAIDAQASFDTRNIRVRSVVANPNERLRPGMFVSVVVPTDTPMDVVAVPATAIRRATYGDNVYVVTKNAEGAFVANLRQVKLGPALGELVIVTSGLRAGDQIAAAGSFKLQDGSKIAVEQPAPAQAEVPSNAK